MAQNSSSRIDEGALTKGQRRKLNALRKSVGDEVGERAFAEWLATRPAPTDVKLGSGKLANSMRLRKSVGDEVGERAFAEWLATRPVAKSDENATMIVDTLWPLVQQGKLAIPRGGYLLRRGRGRIIVEPAKQ